MEVKSITTGFSKNKMDAIFHHPECFKMFGERIAEARIEGNEYARILSRAFSKIFLLIPNTELGLNDGEFTQLCNALETDENGVLNVHTGTIIKIIALIKQSQPKEYCLDTDNYLLVMKSCKAISDEIQAISEPIRNACIDAFWMNATQQQMNDVQHMLKQMEGRANGNTIAMPGNEGIPRFNKFAQ